jgi:hypothetical protein
MLLPCSNADNITNISTAARQKVAQHWLKVIGLLGVTALALTSIVSLSFNQPSTPLRPTSIFATHKSIKEDMFATTIATTLPTPPNPTHHPDQTIPRLSLHDVEFQQEREQVVGQKIMIVIPAGFQYFDTRGGAIASTWMLDALASKDRIVLKFFFGSDVNVIQVHNTARRLGVPLSSLHFLKKAKDVEYPPVYKNTETLMEAAQLAQATPNEYGWILKVDDDTLVNVNTLLTFTSMLDPTKAMLLGQQGWGDANDVKQLQLNKPYCMGGPGYLMSITAVRRLVKYMPSCVEEADRSKIREHMWHSDIVIGLCFQQYLNLGCWEADDAVSVSSLLAYDKFKFYHNYQQEWNPSSKMKYHAITLHPLKEYKTMKDVYTIIANKGKKITMLV